MDGRTRALTHERSRNQMDARRINARWLPRACRSEQYLTDSAKLFLQIVPRCSGSKHPRGATEDTPAIHAWHTMGFLQKHWLDDGPLVVGRSSMRQCSTIGQLST
jgi:hypothetical protein